ncbi:hypothetical protein GWI33_015030 [Rhynchophorus ferrugineus]|uniref:Uncharacterized protein n=1 Tax=Rhynchophorus ferrugineus TaxID=354439 RepID=A0A834I3C5_RHYFE|nr:hypothetical protein GWI33_015030 [Rhynchophorus ferrugineus]
MSLLNGLYQIRIQIGRIKFLSLLSPGAREIMKTLRPALGPFLPLPSTPQPPSPQFLGGNVPALSVPLHRSIIIPPQSFQGAFLRFGFLFFSPNISNRAIVGRNRYGESKYPLNDYIRSSSIIRLDKPPARSGFGGPTDYPQRPEEGIYPRCKNKRHSTGSSPLPRSGLRSTQFQKLKNTIRMPTAVVGPCVTSPRPSVRLITHSAA